VLKFSNCKVVTDNKSSGQGLSGIANVRIALGHRARRSTKVVLGVFVSDD